MQNRDGTTHIILKPLDSIARLAVRVRKPRVNLTRFHGVFDPNSHLRSQVTPAKRGKRTADEANTLAQRRAAMTWAKSLKRVFKIDIEFSFFDAPNRLMGLPYCRPKVGGPGGCCTRTIRLAQVGNLMPVNTTFLRV